MAGTRGIIARILALELLRKREHREEDLKPRLQTPIPLKSETQFLSGSTFSTKSRGTKNLNNDTFNKVYKLPTQSDPDIKSKTILHIWHTGYKTKREIIDPTNGEKIFEEIFIRTSTPEIAMLQLGLRVPFIGTIQEKHKMLEENGISIGHAALEYVSFNEHNKPDHKYLSVGPGGEVVQAGDKQEQLPGKALVSGHINEMMSWQPDESIDISEIVDQRKIAQFIDFHHNGNDPETKVHSKKGTRLEEYPLLPHLQLTVQLLY